MLYKEKWHKQKPLSVLDDDGVTLFYDFTIRTNCAIKANGPDIVAKDFKEHKYCLINMIMPSDKSISTSEYRENLFQ